MSEPAFYPVAQLRTDSPEVTEQLGSKEKFWFRMESDDQPWLFKFTRENTGEDWSEKIASEVAALLGLRAARVELAEFMGRRGCASRSFVRRHEGFDLVHGSELLAGRVLGYEMEKQWNQSSHCLSNIIEAVDKTFELRGSREQLSVLAGFIILDAVICNTDRHHDNWGLLRGPSDGGKAMHEIAPSFDHASSLGRELLDVHRAQKLRERLIERYALRGHGGIYWAAEDAKGENPLKLAARAAEEYPLYFRPWLKRIHAWRHDDFAEIVARIPHDWMSREARQFACELVTYTVQTLKALPL